MKNQNREDESQAGWTFADRIAVSALALMIVSLAAVAVGTIAIEGPSDALSEAFLSGQLLLTI